MLSPGYHDLTIPLWAEGEITSPKGKLGRGAPAVATSGPGESPLYLLLPGLYQPP